MKKLLTMILFMVASMAGITAQNIFSTDNGRVSFYSEAPIADVDAVNDKMNVELNSATQELTCSIVMKDFEFKNGKMGRDAEKKYLETAAYPYASFKGKIEGNINYEKPGSYPATAIGKLTIHGVEKQISEKGTIIVQQDQIKLESRFNVQLKDYKIDTPKILGYEMTEDNVLVTIDAMLKEQPRKTITRK